MPAGCSLLRSVVIIPNTKGDDDPPYISSDHESSGRSAVQEGSVFDMRKDHGNGGRILVPISSVSIEL